MAKQWEILNAQYVYALRRKRYFKKLGVSHKKYYEESSRKAKTLRKQIKDLLKK